MKARLQRMARSIRNPQSTIRNSQRAQALVEYAIVFPLQLMLTLGIIQLAHIFVAKQVLDYAAFCGARASLVGLDDADAMKAAVIPVSRIAGPSGVAPRPDLVEIPGWGYLRNADAADEKMTDPHGRFDVASVSLVSGTGIRCEITHAYELRVPIGNMVSYALCDVFLGAEDIVMIGDAPHIRMQATCTLPQPWAE